MSIEADGTTDLSKPYPGTFGHYATQAVACPTCDAPKGEPCTGHDIGTPRAPWGIAPTTHDERVRAHDPAAYERMHRLVGVTIDRRLMDANEKAHVAETRLKHLLDASGELIDALDADNVRDPGDADSEKLVEIRLGTAIERLRETLAYIKKAT